MPRSETGTMPAETLKGAEGNVSGDPEGSKDWDWQPGVRIIHEFDASKAAGFISYDELRFSADGTSVAWVEADEEGELRPNVNGQSWSISFDNIWNLRFTPNNRLLALVSSMGTWSLAIDGEVWPEEYEYIWNPLISRSGQVISAAIKKDGLYGMSVNGVDWPVLYPNATGFTQSADGHQTAAAVQTESLDEGDIQTFKRGIYTISLNGEAWPETFVNVWAPCLQENGTGAAATVRLSRTEYSIAVNGECWPERYGMAWEPCFHPSDDSVLAPVRVGSRWALAQDGQIIWPAKYLQLWHQQVARNGTIAAIVAPRFGVFTVAVNDRTWRNTYPVLTDLVLHPDGKRAAAVGQGGMSLSDDGSELSTQQWQVIVDDRPWSRWYDRIFTPVISQDGLHVAVRAEQAGNWTVLVDNRRYHRTFDRLWDPVFSPDGRKLLLKALDGNKALRIVVDLNELKL